MKNKLLYICFLLLLFVSCRVNNINIGSKQKNDSCNAATGYQWSTIKNECIRVFEQPNQLRSVSKAPMETICAFIFNETNDQVEVFADTTVVLGKKSLDNFEGKYASKKYNLSKINNKWQLTIDSILVYTE